MKCTTKASLQRILRRYLRQNHFLKFSIHLPVNFFSSCRLKFPGKNCRQLYGKSKLTDCWFSVSRHSKQIKIKVKTVQQIKSRIWEMKEGKYGKTSPRFRSEQYFVYDISKEMFYPNLQRFVWRRHAGPDEHQRGGRKPAEASFTEFCYKSVNLFFEELINIKVILFAIHKLFRGQNSLK